MVTGSPADGGISVNCGSEEVIELTIRFPALLLHTLRTLTAFVAVVLDYPFTDDVRISRAPFEQALAQMPPPLPPP